MDSGLPWSSVVTLGVALVALGAVGGKLIQIATTIKGLERSREKLGERLGELEKRLAIAEERRRLTQPNLRPVGGGKVLKPVTDESSSTGGDDDG
jgi:hypothetical protein